MKGCRPLTDSEVEQTLQSFGGPYASGDRALFLLGVRSGFRISETPPIVKATDTPRSGISSASTNL